MFERLTPEDKALAFGILGDRNSYEPDLVIAPDGEPYLYRWHVIPHALKKLAGVFLHIQVASDPERPLHDHPWDNTSVILGGGYDEQWSGEPWFYPRWMDLEYHVRRLRRGDTVFRKATEAHRLILPPEFPYTMTLFTCGPVVREWGFWFKEGWRNADDVLRMEGRNSIMQEGCREKTV